MLRETFMRVEKIVVKKRKKKDKIQWLERLCSATDTPMKGKIKKKNVKMYKHPEKKLKISVAL